MQNNSGDDFRNVVPRWRPLGSLPKAEILAVPRYKPLHQALPEIVEADLGRWRVEKKLESGVDIFDTGTVFGDDGLIREGVRLIRAHGTAASERIIEAVDRAFVPEPNYKAKQDRTAQLELKSEYVHKTIAMLKRQVRNSPRDALSYLELARLHTILAQHSAAERYLRTAIQLDPNGRLTLRAAVQYYQVVGDLPMALPLLWRSESIRRDPWLQSAEIAAADLSGRGSRFAKSAGASIRGVSELDISKSELALAVATLDLDAGVRPGKVFAMVAAGLVHSTENALAQGVWLGDQTTRSLSSRFPELDFGDDAHEAKARHFYELENYESCYEEAVRWLQDQPFQSEPFCWIANTAVTHLDSYEALVPLAERYLSLHANDWAVLNCCVLIFASAGQFVRAAETAHAMERLAHGEVVKAFSEAALGMIALRVGNDQEGRQRYESAIQLAKGAKRPELVVSAYMFYLWGEAIAARCTSSEILKGMHVAEKLSDRLPADSKVEARRTWKSIKRKIEALLVLRQDLSQSEVDAGPKIILENDLQLATLG